MAFYQGLGFQLLYGGPQALFTSFQVGDGYLNLQAGPVSGLAPRQQVCGADHLQGSTTWTPCIGGRRQAGYRPATAPADAPWGERYFHIRDPDGHEVSFARPLDSR